MKARYADVPHFPTGAPLSCIAEPDLIVLAQQAGKTIGLGGLRRFDAETAEVKHIYVRPSARRCGAARAIIAELERRARALGYTALRLDTGHRQPEAIALYQAFGYREIPAYNSNPGAERWFEKRLRGTVQERR